MAKLDEVLPGLVDPDKWLLNVDEVLAGVKHVLADIGGRLRQRSVVPPGVYVGYRSAGVREGRTSPRGRARNTNPISTSKELVKEIPPHRVLAINRGEKANALRVRSRNRGASGERNSRLSSQPG